MIRKILLSVLSWVILLPVSASENPAILSGDEKGMRADEDTLYNELTELNVVAVKQAKRLREEALSSTLVNTREIEQLGIEGIKGVSSVVPNFYMPDYGSRITSTMYVRGIGARMDQPAVGLNVDNVPYLNKNAYDFDISDIDLIEMLRGPQSTLYGRNTMGGLINITTLSPMNYQGLRIRLEGATANTYRGSIGWFTRPKENFATSISGNFGYTAGYFTNKYTGKKLDHEIGGGLRWKTQLRLSKSVFLQNVLASSLLRQGGYPYEFIETGEINYNDTCFYRRFTINDGLTLNYRASEFTLTSVTAVQHIDDNMTLDQDFLPLPYFTLTQKQKETSFTEDILFKGSKREGAYQWLGGFFGFYKGLNMYAPVTFKDTGISALIESHCNNANPYYPIEWDTRSFVLNSDFEIPTYGLAFYHESKFNISSWEFTGGIRFDYESAGLHYRSFCDTGYMIYQNTGGTLTPYVHSKINIDDRGKLRRSYFNWMPRVSALYNFDGNVTGNVYGVISKGYKAGGFNTQMFSEVLQSRLMSMMGIGGQHSVDDVVGYKPEYSWNYEIGSHLITRNGRVSCDLSLFYIDCHNQQLTTFPNGTTTGRIMTNAGKTRSFGGEISITGTPIKELQLTCGYGYTNAKFVEYNDGHADYKGKYIPYAPQNTLFIQSLVTITFKKEFLGLNRFLWDVNMRGTGKIYWNESNSYSQPFYAELASSLTLAGDKWSIRIYGDNLTNTRFHTFYFMSMGNSFVQRGKPIRGGLTISMNI